jgi:ribosomal protein S18 acetylase RimI-like enzyme
MGYVFGVAILPDFRGRGYGRAMLDAVLKRHFQQSGAPVILEVAVKNDGALTLYKSCGFAEITIYDYYEMKLESPPGARGAF